MQVRPCDNCWQLNAATADNKNCKQCGYIRDETSHPMESWTPGISVLLVQIERISGSAAEYYTRYKYEQLIQLDEQVHSRPQTYDDETIEMSVGMYQQTVRDLARLHHQYQLPIWRYQQTLQQPEWPLVCGKRVQGDLIQLIDCLWPKSGEQQQFSGMIRQFLVDLPQIVASKRELSGIILIQQQINEQYASTADLPLLLEYIDGQVREAYSKYQQSAIEPHFPLLEEINRKLFHASGHTSMDALKRGILRSIYQQVSRQLMAMDLSINSNNN